MEPEIIHRILIGRRMLSGFGITLTRESDALIVAQAILVAHDAAELIVSAIAAHVDAERTERTMFMEYIGAITKKTGKAFPGRSFFETLNRQRISFKHHGLLPNVDEFHRVLTRAYEPLDEATIEFIGQQLSEFDESGLLTNSSAREIYLEARRAKNHGEHRQSLETLAFAVEEAVRGTPLQFAISAGQADPKVALELTAYGVDPGAYIRIQEFLPTINIEGDVHWDRRIKGTEATGRNKTCPFASTRLWTSF